MIEFRSQIFQWRWLVLSIAFYLSGSLYKHDALAYGSFVLYYSDVLFYLSSSIPTTVGMLLPFMLWCSIRQLEQEFHVEKLIRWGNSRKFVSQSMKQYSVTVMIAVLVVILTSLVLAPGTILNLEWGPSLKTGIIGSNYNHISNVFKGVFDSVWLAFLYSISCLMMSLLLFHVCLSMIYIISMKPVVIRSIALFLWFYALVCFYADLNVLRLDYWITPYLAGDEMLWTALWLALFALFLYIVSHRLDRPWKVSK